MSTSIHSRSVALGLPPAWTRVIPGEAYHAESLAGRVMSSGMLKEFRLCPANYHALIAGLRQKREYPAFRFGRAAHTFILEGEGAFRRDFGVGGPVNERTGRPFGADSQAYADWAGEQGLDRRRMVTRTEYEDLRRMREAMTRHAEGGRLLAEGWAERSAMAEVEEVPCQIRLDWLRPDGVAVDLKTVEDITRFEQDARRYGYLHQFAFYREAARAAGGGELAFAAVVVEKRAPYRTGVWNFSAEILAPYAAENQRALRAYRRCRRDNRWPTGYEQPRSFPPAGVPPLLLN